MKDLLKNNYEKKRKLSMGEKTLISNSFNLENYFSNENSKDKLKNLEKQLNKKTNIYTNNIPKSNYNNNNKLNNKNKLKYDFSSKFYNNKNNIFKNNENEIENFADFSLKKNNEKIPLRTRTFSSNRIEYNNNNFNFDFPKSNLNSYKNNNYNINENEIKNLSSKIRFLSKEDIKNMNKSLINELLSLSNSIKRIFQDYNNNN